jgi:hypothetical protein
MLLHNYIERVLRWLTGRRPPPEEPFNSVRQPVRRGPPTRSARVALEEPPPLQRINVFGIKLPHRFAK